MEKKIKEKGITLIALTVMITILLIIAGITIYGGKGTIEKAELEELKTNMLLIEAKAKEYVENANFKLGMIESEKESKLETAKAELKGDIIPKPDYVQTESTGKYVFCCELTVEQLNEMGIPNVKSDEKNGEYIVVYDIDKATVEVYNSDGFNGKYSLNEIKNITM